MKKYILSIGIFMFMLLSSAVFAGNTYKNPHAKLSPEAEKIRVQQIEMRIQEIKLIDKSALSFEERRALRREVTQMRKEMKGFTSGGVYLSAAAIIIIILVIILFI